MRGLFATSPSSPILQQAAGVYTSLVLDCLPWSLGRDTGHLKGLVFHSGRPHVMRRRERLPMFLRLCEVPCRPFRCDADATYHWLPHRCCIFLFCLFVCSLHLVPRAFLGMVSLLLGNAYIVGINQIYDVEIDKVGHAQ